MSLNSETKAEYFHFSINYIHDKVLTSGFCFCEKMFWLVYINVLKITHIAKNLKYFSYSRTTDTRSENCLHCTAENPIPIPNSLIWLKHILSATAAQIFRYIWFMPSLGVRSPCTKLTLLWARKISLHSTFNQTYLYMSNCESNLM